MLHSIKTHASFPPTFESALIRIFQLTFYSDSGDSWWETRVTHSIVALRKSDSGKRAKSGVVSLASLCAAPRDVPWISITPETKCPSARLRSARAQTKNVKCPGVVNVPSWSIHESLKYSVCFCVYVVLTKKKRMESRLPNFSGLMTLYF